MLLIVTKIEVASRVEIIIQVLVVKVTTLTTLVTLTEPEMMNKWGKTPLPRPIRIHHVIEDFLTQWTAQQSHILPLRRFFESILDTDLRHYYAHTCLSHALTTGSAPKLCRTGVAPRVWPSHGLVQEPLDGSSGAPEFVSDNSLPSVLPVTPGSATAALASATS